MAFYYQVVEKRSNHGLNFISIVVWNSTPRGAETGKNSSPSMEQGETGRDRNVKYLPRLIFLEKLPFFKKKLYEHSFYFIMLNIYNLIKRE